MPCLSKSQRSETLGMLRTISCKNVAYRFNVDRKTIERLKMEYRRTGDVADLRRPGAPHKTDAAKDRLIVTSHCRDRFKCAAETSITGSVDIKLVLRRF